jgi:hypothetical protein
MHQNKPPTWLVHIPGHPWVLGQATGTLTHLTHHGPNSGVCHHHTPYSILCDTPRHPRPNVTFSQDSRVGIPKLSRVELLLPITWATDVQMTNERPFSISTLQDLSNDIKNTSMRGVLGLVVEL